MTKKAVIYSDGGARGNPGPAAVGVLICDDQGNEIEEYAEVIGETTNNVAEYKGVLVGLEMAKKLGFEEIHYFGDSELVVRQLSGIYKVKTPHILVLYQQVKVLEKFFKKITYQHVPRTHEKIQHVDALVNQVLDAR